MSEVVVFDVQDVVVWYLGNLLVIVVNGVLICVVVGEIVVFVGEFGSGKFSFVCVVVGIEKIVGGIVWFCDVLVLLFGICCCLIVLIGIQMVFQDLVILLNFWCWVGDQIVDGIVIVRVWGVEGLIVEEWFECVGFLMNVSICFLYQFLGGQKQCIVIVRVLVV